GRLRRAFQHHLARLTIELPNSAVLLEAETCFSQLRIKRRIAAGPVHVDHQEDPTARAARREAAQALHRRFAEIRGEPRDENELAFLRDLPGLTVVFRDRLKLVAAIHLYDFLHMFVHLREAFLDLLALRPDPT